MGFEIRFVNCQAYVACSLMNHMNERWRWALSHPRNRTLRCGDGVDLVEDDGVLGGALSNLELVHQLAEHQDESRKGSETRRTVGRHQVLLERGKELDVLRESEALGPDRLATARVLEHAHDRGANECGASGLVKTTRPIREGEVLNGFA